MTDAIVREIFSIIFVFVYALVTARIGYVLRPKLGVMLAGMAGLVWPVTAFAFGLFTMLGCDPEYFEPDDYPR